MAISLTHYSLLRELFLRKLLPQGGSVLEIGEANWYGDPVEQIAKDIDAHCDDRKASFLMTELSKLAADKDDRVRLFGIAKLIYKFLFASQDVTSIDMRGSAAALPLDLNGPLDLGRQFDVAINHGTAEHIFNIARVFVSMHEAVKPGGLMIHEAPFTGWIDHGFYNLQPTLFMDVSQVNKYAIRMFAIEDINKSVQFVRNREELHELAREGKIPANAMCFVAMQKSRSDEPFRIPMQGYYAGTISDEARKAWKELRGSESDWLAYSMSIAGWMTEEELRWLYDAAKGRKCVVEIGVWKGRSTSALAAAGPEAVYAIDHWCGAPGEEHTYIEAIDDREHVISQARKNLERFSNVRIVENGSLSAANDGDVDGPIDMLFIDGAHDYASVKADLEAWTPMLADGALVCGHDYNDRDVRRATKEVFGDRVKQAAGTIWYVE